MKPLTKMSIGLAFLASLSSPLQAHEAKMKSHSMHQEHREMVKQFRDYEQQIKSQIQVLEREGLGKSQQQTLALLKKVLDHHQKLHRQMLRMHSQMMKTNAKKDNP